MSEKGGSPGDLIIKLKVNEDKEFKKTGLDIFSDHVISPARVKQLFQMNNLCLIINIGNIRWENICKDN